MLTTEEFTTMGYSLLVQTPSPPSTETLTPQFDTKLEELCFVLLKGLFINQVITDMEDVQDIQHFAKKTTLWSAEMVEWVTGLPSETVISRIPANQDFGSTCPAEGALLPPLPDVKPSPQISGLHSTLWFGYN